MMDGLAIKAARGSAFVLANTYFNIAVGFVASLVLTRLLAPEHFGVVSLGSFFFSLVNLRSKLGIGYALAQRQSNAGDLTGTHLVLDLGSGLSSLMLALLSLPILGILGYSQDIGVALIAFALIGSLEASFGTPGVLLEKELRFGIVSTVSVIGFAASYAPAIVMALHGYGYWSLLAQPATYTMLQAVALWWACRRSMPEVCQQKWRFDPGVAREFLMFGGTLAIGSVAATFLYQFDNFLVGSLVSVSELGFYDRAYRIAQWPTLLTISVVSRVALYTYSRVRDDPVRLAKALNLTMWLIATFATPIALAVFVTAPETVELLFGARWLPSAPFLRLLIAYSILRPATENAGVLFIALGRPRLTTTVVVTEAVALILSGIPLTLAFGAAGTAAAVGLSFGIGFALGLYLLHKVTRCPIPGIFVPPLVAALVSSLLFFVSGQLLDFNALPLLARVAAKTALIGMAFFAALLALQGKEFLARGHYLGSLLKGEAFPGD